MDKTKGNVIRKRIATVLLILVLLWLILSTVDVWNGNGSNWSFWTLCSRGTETEMEVAACVKSQGDSYWTVFVVDSNGNEWAYYDSEYMEKGTQLCVSFNGNEIVKGERK